MARPPKNNADYFPHDHNLRNDRRVKALRAKSGKLSAEAYGVYIMLMETLTGSAYFEIPAAPLELELIAGDFDMPVEKLTEYIKYSTEVGLLIQENGVLYSPDLIESMQALLDYREKDRQRKSDRRVFHAENDKRVFPSENETGVFHAENSKKRRKGRVFLSENDVFHTENPVFHVENTQSKVNKSKEDNNIAYKGDHITADNIIHSRKKENPPVKDSENKKTTLTATAEKEKSSAQKEKEPLPSEFSSCKQFFLAQAKGYYWEERDDRYLAELLIKIKSTIAQDRHIKERHPAENFKALITNLPDYWRTKKFTISHLALNYNEIINEIRTNTTKTYGAKQHKDSASKFGRHNIIDFVRRAGTFGRKSS